MEKNKKNECILWKKMKQKKRGDLWAKLAPPCFNPRVMQVKFFLRAENINPPRQKMWVNLAGSICFAICNWLLFYENQFNLIFFNSFKNRFRLNECYIVYIREIPIYLLSVSDNRQKEVAIDFLITFVQIAVFFF